MRVPHFAVSMTWTLLCVALFLASAFEKVPVYFIYMVVGLYAVGILTISAVYSGVIVCCCCRRLADDVEAATTVPPSKPQSKKKKAAKKKHGDLEDPSSSDEDEIKVYTRWLLLRISLVLFFVKKLFISFKSHC